MYTEPKLANFSRPKLKIGFGEFFKAEIKTRIGRIFSRPKLKIRFGEFFKAEIKTRVQQISHSLCEKCVLH